jgi:hypothetical protein
MTARLRWRIGFAGLICATLFLFAVRTLGAVLLYFLVVLWLTEWWPPFGARLAAMFRRSPR